MKTITCAVLTAILLAAGNAYADNGLSVGASLGYANIENDDPAFDFDANDTGYKFFANYSFANYLAFEGGFVDFGEPTDDVLGIPGKDRRTRAGRFTASAGCPCPTASSCRRQV